MSKKTKLKNQSNPTSNPTNEQPNEQPSEQPNQPAAPQKPKNRVWKKGGKFASFEEASKSQAEPCWEY